MDTALLARYEAQRVPRYTSYPTAPQFGPSVDAATYAAWLSALPPEAAGSLYLHVPFCRTLCWYCGCHTRATAHDAPVAAYCESLLDEVELVAGHLPHRLRVGHLHWGGGTPTLIGARLFAAIMDRIQRRFELGAEAEIAVEIDPRHVPDEVVAALREAGVNRVSLGVQSFDPAVQAAINRVQSYETTARAVERLRESGARGINIDLVYGLPRQTAASCAETVERVATLAPDRVAVFGYAHVPWMKRHQRLIAEADLPTGRARFEQFRTIADRLKAAGYVPIGLDHFARPDDPLAKAAAARRLRRNFQGYTTDGADVLLGFGASAIGALPSGYVQNHADVPTYRRAVSDARLPIARGVALSTEDVLRRELIEQLMCYGEVDLSAVLSHHWTSGGALVDVMPRLAELEADGVIAWSGPVLRVADECRPLVRTVAAAFDGYLTESAGRHAPAV